MYENIGSLTFDLSDGQSSDVIEGANDVNSGGAKYFRITHINSHMGEPLQLNSVSSIVSLGCIVAKKL